VQLLFLHFSPKLEYGSQSGLEVHLAPYPPPKISLNLINLFEFKKPQIGIRPDPTPNHNAAKRPISTIKAQVIDSVLTTDLLQFDFFTSSVLNYKSKRL
jgi:hypothetical protein